MRRSASVAWICPILWLTATAIAQPANDTCGTALTVDVGAYSFNTAGASAESGCHGPLPAVWYQYTAPAAPGKYEFHLWGCTASFEVSAVMTIFDACGGTQIACGSGCAFGATAAAYLAPSQTVVAMLGTETFFPFPGPAIGSGTLNVASSLVHPWSEIDDGGADAGDLPSIAQEVAGSGPVDRIIGRIVTQNDVDIYKIHVCDHAAFSATSRRSSTFPGTPGGTSFALFDETGHGVTYNDDAVSDVDQSTITSQFVPADGIYYLAVCSESRRSTSGGAIMWNDTPTHTGEYPPNGPGASGIVDGWTNFGSDPTDYRIALTGVCFISNVPLCAADLDDGSGTGTPDAGVDINDLLFFLGAFEGGTLAADLDDGSGTGTPDNGVDINDLLFFLAHFEAGC